MISEAQESMDMYDMQRFYATVNGTWHKTAPVQTMFNDKKEYILTDGTIAI